MSTQKLKLQHLRSNFKIKVEDGTAAAFCPPGGAPLCKQTDYLKNVLFLIFKSNLKPNPHPSKPQSWRARLQKKKKKKVASSWEVKPVNQTRQLPSQVQTIKLIKTKTCLLSLPNRYRGGEPWRHVTANPRPGSHLQLCLSGGRATNRHGGQRNWRGKKALALRQSHKWDNLS